MKTMLTLIALVALVGAAQAQVAPVPACYGWENSATSLGEYGFVYYALDGTHVSDGTSALMVKESASGTGQIYAAYISGLQEGDEVTASFDVYDDTPGSEYPSTRIWGHYALTGDAGSYDGSAGGNATYSDGLGWNNLSMTWVMPAGKTCLVVEIRPYGGSTTYDADLYNWVDNICVTVPDRDSISIEYPGGVVADDVSSFGSLKALYR